MDHPIRLLCCVILLIAGRPLLAQESTPVDFARDIHPILSDTCFKCHGPDEADRQADLRLDTEQGLFEDSDVIERGDASNSELYARITSDDPDTLMPPPDSGRRLSDEQKQKIKSWINSGANWQQHWSFEPPERVDLPVIDDMNWVQTPVDHFVLKQLQALGLQPNPPARRTTMIRRLSFDLTGLPPTGELLEKYSNSKSADWYEQLVDELLRSPHYGEHMARYWLDAARYGDTHGLHLDNYREMWLYRDWVINAFNDNKSFRDFTIEQLAGDLLPNPTEDQIIATGFNRSHVTTAEGGSIKEEVYVRNVVDRVSTTGTVFMGLTVGCAQCHDHKFDPISQKEFYQLFAFFNNLDADPMDGNRKDHAPILKVASNEQKQEVAAKEEKLKSVEAELKQLIADFSYTDPGAESGVAELAEPAEFVWVDDRAPEGVRPEQRWQFVSKKDGPVFSGEQSRLQESNDAMVQHFFTGAPIPLQVTGDDMFFAYVFLDPENPPAQLMLQFNDGNWEHRAYWGGDKIEWGNNRTVSRYYMGSLPETGKWIRLEVSAATVGFSDLSEVNGIAFTQWGGRAHWDKAGVVSKLPQNVRPVSLAVWASQQMLAKGKGLPGPVNAIVSQPQEKWNEDQIRQAREYFLTNVFEESKKIAEPKTKEIADLKNQIKQARESWPSTLVWKERPEIKPAFILNRGEYDQPGEQVERQVPSSLPPLPDDAPRDRLGLAQWLVSGEHPLTARVAVNRFWQQLFGHGFVLTSEDFGAQGAVPTHPELLDWLATDFSDNNWDIKRLMKRMVMSSTYRQSAKYTEKKLKLDPDNRFYSRGPRFRLDAESLRDQALAVSGLLVPTIGGPSVKPPQPDGLWFVVGYSGSNTVRFKKDTGHEKVHRRSMYTFWKRTAPPPQMNTLDAPSRESCLVRRERTNTPLQALLLMNDPQYVEAARFLAQRLIDKSHVAVKTSPDASDVIVDRINHLYLWTLCREPDPDERKSISEAFTGFEKEFKANPTAAGELIAIGETPADKKYDPVELASWTMIANLIMNTDEFVSKN